MIEQGIIRSYVWLQVLCFIGGVVFGAYFGGMLIMYAFIHATAKWSRIWLKIFGIK